MSWVFLWGEKMPLPTAAELTDPNATNAQMKQRLGQLAENLDRSYNTLAEANADIAEIPVGVIVKIKDPSESGEYIKTSTASTSLEKGSFDTKTQAINESNKYADETKAPLENFNASGNPDHLVEIKDASGKLVAAWNLKAEFMTKLLTDGIIQSVEQPDGSFVLTIGDGREVNLYGSTFTLDFSNPDVAFQILSSDNKIIFSVPIDGVDLEDVASQNKSVEKLSTAFAVLNRSDGLPTSEVFQSERLSETRRKIAALEAGENQQLIITSIGNSWLDTPSYGTQPLVKALKKRYGNAGAGFAAPDRGFADPDEAILIKNGSWVNTNGALSNGVDAEGAAIIKATTLTAGSYVQAQLSSGKARHIKLYAKANSAVIEVSGSGISTHQISISQTVTEINCNLDVSNSGTQYARFKLISGEFTVFGVELQNTEKGIRFNKCAAGGSRWSRWLSTNASIWQEQIAALGADLTIMMEGVNGSFAYDAASEANYTDQIINRVRTATKNTDILLLSPPEIIMAHSYSLEEYQYALRGKAKDWKVCHVDLQKTFGDVLSDYDDSGRAYIIASNPNHPSPLGALLISGTLLKIILGA